MTFLGGLFSPFLIPKNLSSGLFEIYLELFVSLMIFCLRDPLWSLFLALTWINELENLDFFALILAFFVGYIGRRARKKKKGRPKNCPSKKKGQTQKK